MIVGLRLAALKPVTKYEITGCAVALFGCVVTTFDPEAIKTSDEDNHIQLGNFLCFISSIFATIYILKGQEVSAQVPPIPYLLVLTGILVALFCTVFPIIYLGKNFHFSMDRDTGIFGWLSMDTFWYNFLVVSGINGIFTLWLQMLVFK
jgi:drug/metabolite transporter (DMT)-like permease